MASTLSRLFHYAKSFENREALENFATEALAAAIRHEATPFLALLADKGLIDRDSNQPAVTVRTQLYVQEVGIFDLVVADGSQGRWEVWIEVKINSGLSGDQLPRYAKYCSKHPPARLALLSPSHLLPNVPWISWISWQDVWQAIVGHTPASPYWRDLKLFLEEIHMADSFHEPIGSCEAAALEHARSMFRKVQRILKQAAIKANEIWPGSDWPTDDEDIRKVLNHQFWWHNYLAIYNKCHAFAGAKIGIGYDSAADFQDAWVGLWVFADPSPKYSNAINAIRELRPKLGSDWHDGVVEDWELIGSYRRLKSFPKPQDVSDFLIQQLQQLSDADILAKIPLG